MPQATTAQMIEAARKRTENDEAAVKELMDGRAERNATAVEPSDEQEVVLQSTDEPEGTPKPEVVVEKAAEQTSNDDDGTKALTVEERLDLMDKELELRDLKLTRVEQKSQKWENLAQKRAGELDYLSKSGGRTNESADTDIWSELTADETDDKPRGGNVDLSEFEEEQLSNVRQQTQLRFLNEYEKDLYVGDGDEKTLDPTFVEILKEVRSDYEDELASNSPKSIRKATESVLKESRMILKERQLETSMADVRKRRANVSQKARDRKLATQASESSASTTSIDTGGKSIEDMTSEEMATFLRKDPNRSRYRA